MTCPPTQRQHGSVLLVTIVMIFMMALLGAASMRGATLEVRLANNSLQKELTFQAAESATDLLLAQPGVLEDIICKAERTVQMSEVSDGDAHVTTASLIDGGRTHPIGYELGGPISARRFMISAQSELPGASTRTRIAQGAMLIGASDFTGGC